MREASTAAGIHRQTFWRWVSSMPDFAQAVVAAREEGKAERVYRAWLGHYRRGMRPPTGKGHGGKPRFAYQRKAFRDLSNYARKRMVTHLNRRSQRKYHRPKGLSHYQYLQDLGLQSL